MNPTVQIIPLQPKNSFVADTFQTSQFENSWHLHSEYELILFTEGNGRVCVGKKEDTYQAGDIFFLGANTPHQFQPHNNNLTKGVIIHFTGECLGSHFFDLPECHSIKLLLEISVYGLKIIGKASNQLSNMIISLGDTNCNRIIVLLQCLQLMASNKEYITFNTSKCQEANQTDDNFLNKILKYTNDAFHDLITLPKVAAIVYMSVPTFCSYFKRHTNKTYITYLNEVRVQYACYQLLQTNKPVTDIGYESGYNTVAHFHRQFQRLKKTTPLQYRKQRTLN